jgi:hypothetical protein
MGLTALHEVLNNYGHHYRWSWELNPTQQQRRKSKDPSASVRIDAHLTAN